MAIGGAQVILRPLRSEDIERVATIQSQPGVACWWGAPDLDELGREARGEENPTSFTIEAAGELVGLIQFHEENEPDYRHAGIDIFLAEEVHGRGLGTDAVLTLARYLVDERGHRRITIDPAVENTAAIRTYEKAGFKPVGIMREYSRAPDGHWRDGLLMDLLASELARPAPR